MRKNFLPLSVPDIGDEEINEIADSIKSGWITTGPKVKKFEKEFSEFTKSKYAIAVNSATAGLHITYTAMNLKGKKVITTPLTFVSTVNMLLASGAEVVFADIDKKTLNIDIKQIEEKLKQGASAIVPVHFAGIPCDMDEIVKLAKKYNAKIIEDCAHAIGTTYKRKHAGTFGNAGVFSFHPIKNITTGEGGMVITDNQDLANKLMLLRFHGMDKDAWKRYDKTGKIGYDIVELGFKYNMMDIQAAIGIHQLKKVKYFNEKRKNIAQYYRNELSNLEEISLQEFPDYEFEHPWHLFVIILKTNKITRQQLMDELKKRNIGTSIHFPAVFSFSYYKKLSFTGEDCPNASFVGNNILSLPLFPKMTIEDAEYVITSLKEIFSKL